MALDIMSATTLSSTSSFGCIDNFPKPPSSVHMRPSKSSISNSTNNLLPPPLSSYPPMPRSKIDLKYIPIDPLYLPWRHPSLPFRLGEDISRTGAGTQYIGITAWDLTLAYISLHQDGTLLHYSQPFPPDDIIDLETCNVLKRCTRVGRAAWLLWKEIVLLFKACTPQWWRWWRGRNIRRVCPKYQTAEEDRKWIEMLRTRRIPWNMITETSFPLILMDFSMTHSQMTNRHSPISSNSGAWLNSFINLFPLITYHFTRWVTSPLLLSSIFTLMTPFPVLHHHFAMAVLLCLLRLHVMTHFWLIFDLTLFSMLVEYSSNDVVITLSA